MTVNERLHLPTTEAVVMPRMYRLPHVHDMFSLGNIGAEEMNSLSLEIYIIIVTSKLKKC